MAGPTQGNHMHLWHAMRCGGAQDKINPGPTPTKVRDVFTQIEIGIEFARSDPGPGHDFDLDFDFEPRPAG
jgi:hypothetical protein